MHRHKAQIISDWFLEHDNEFTLLKWPPQSPDLNPIEHLWDVEEREILITDVQTTNLQQLCDAIMTIWTEISEECFQHLVEHTRQLFYCICYVFFCYGVSEQRTQMLFQFVSEVYSVSVCLTKAALNRIWAKINIWEMLYLFQGRWEIRLRSPWRLFYCHSELIWSPNPGDRWFISAVCRKCEKLQ